MTAQSYDFRIGTALRDEMRGWSKRALIVGIVGAVLCVLGFFVAGPSQFYRSYLWSYVFFLGLALGPMAWLMLQYLSGGAWGVVIRRPAEAAARTLPWVLLMFIPVVIGINNLYSWAHADVVAADPVLQHKHVWLNVPFFLGRAVFYFAGWLFLAFFLNKKSQQEDDGNRDAHNSMSAISGPGIIFWGFTGTFMSIDWMMSLNPHWFSTMYGLLIVAGQGLSSMAFLITLMVLLSQRPPLNAILTPRHLHDLGKLLFAMVMVWAYFSFSQFLIIWAGNLPEEIPWYQLRLNHGWEFVALLLVVGHFALPFALLLSRDLKRNFKLLASIAVFIMFMRFVDLFWVVTPEFAQGGGFHISFLDFAAPIGIGGIWLWRFLSELEKRPLIPLHDPNVEGTLEHGRE